MMKCSQHSIERRGLFTHYKLGTLSDSRQKHSAEALRTQEFGHPHKDTLGGKKRRHSRYK